MLGEWRRLWFWMGWLLLTTVLTGSVAFLLYSHNWSSPEELVQALAAVAAVTGTSAVWLLKHVQPRGPAQLPLLEKAADALTKQLSEEWKQVAADQGLISPPPIPLRWRWPLQPVTGSSSEAVKGQFPPLPGMTAITVENLQFGELEDLLGVYGGLRSGRLLILGESGAGKSDAGIRLLRDALDHRAALPAKYRARVPVPVLVTPQGWDPKTEYFDEWLAALLARDYALLRAPEYGRDVALRLIREGYLAVILDGLDEMPEALRSEALRKLNKQANPFRLVVLSRSEELVTAVRGGHLQGAAALELLPIDPRQAAEYLASCLTDPRPDPWQRLIDHLRDRPKGVLAQALNTPLTLTLVRDTYGPEQRVDELIDVAGRLGSREDIKEHLLKRVLTAAYAQPPDQPHLPYKVDQARRWLGQLARWMNQDKSREFAWWATMHWVPTWPRVFATVVTISVVSAFLIGSLAVLAAKLHFFSAFQIEPQAVLAAVLAKTLGYAFMFGAGLLVMAPPSRKSSRHPDQLRWSSTDILTILLLGAGAGVGVGIEVGIGSGLKQGFAIGLVSSFVVGLGFILGGVSHPQQLGWLRWRKTDTRTSRLVGLAIGLIAGLVAGLGYGLGYGPRFGLVYGFIVGIGYMLVIVVGRRSSPQQSQLQWGRIDTTITLIIGFVIAAVSTAGYGILYVLIVTLAGRSPLQRSRFRWSRTTWAMLLTGLVLGLVLGLVYGFVYGLTYGTYGITYGRELLTLGLGFGLTIGLLLVLRGTSTEATRPLDPQTVWDRERQFALVFGLVFGLVSGLTAGFVDSLVAGPGVGIVFGVAVGIVFGLGSGLVSSVTWAAVLANVQLRRRNDAPKRMLHFLDDAHERQVLRTIGPEYKFRHEQLRELLAKNCETVPSKHADSSSLTPSPPV